MAVHLLLGTHLSGTLWSLSMVQLVQVAAASGQCCLGVPLPEAPRRRWSRAGRLLPLVCRGLCAPFCPQSRCLRRAMSASTAAMNNPWWGAACATGTSPRPSTSGTWRAAAAAAAVRSPSRPGWGWGGWGLLRRVRRGARVSEPVRGSVQTDRSRPWSGESLGASVCSFAARPARCLGLPENRADEPCCVRRVRGPSSQHGAEATRWQAGRRLGWAARCHGQACGQAPLSPFRQKSRPSLLTLGSRGAAAARAWPGLRASAARPPWRATR